MALTGVTYLGYVLDEAGIVAVAGVRDLQSGDGSLRGPLRILCKVPSRNGIKATFTCSRHCRLSFWGSMHVYGSE